jgi:predicted aspartyl protease
MICRFERDPIGGTILVIVKLDKIHTFKMMLDTGASRSTFDNTALCMAGYSIGNLKEKSAIETANGIVEVGVIKVGSLTALGHSVSDVSVQIYDFIAHGILSDYDGVLGIDFFENTKFCIDMKNQTIEVDYQR